MLITCQECNNQVSHQAKVCPHCGIPLYGGGFRGWFWARKIRRYIGDIEEGVSRFKAPFDFTPSDVNSEKYKELILIDNKWAYYLYRTTNCYSRGSFKRKLRKETGRKVFHVSYKEAIYLFSKFLPLSHCPSDAIGPYLYLSYKNKDQSMVQSILKSQGFLKHEWEPYMIECCFDYAPFTPTAYLEFIRTFIPTSRISASDVALRLRPKIQRAIWLHSERYIRFWEGLGIKFDEIGEGGYYTKKPIEEQRWHFWRGRMHLSIIEVGEMISTPLSRAVEENDLEEAKYLLNYRANPNVYLSRTKEEEFDHLSTQVKSKEMYDLLIAHGMNPNPPPRRLRERVLRVGPPLENNVEIPDSYRAEIGSVVYAHGKT